MMNQTGRLSPMRTLVRGARQLLTLRGPAGPRRGASMAELGIIADGAVLIQGGKILEAGPSRRIENLTLARGAQEINAAGRVVMPGFVDSQTRPMVAPALAGRRLEARVRSTLEGMVRHGTTTVAAGAGAELGPLEILATLRLLAGVNGQTLDIIPCYSAATPANAAEVLPILARRKLTVLVTVDCETAGEQATMRILEQANELGFRTTVRAGASAGCARLAAETQAAAVVLKAVDTALMAEFSLSRPIVMAVPASTERQRLGDEATRGLIDSGAAIGLASGFGFDYGPTYNMQMVIALACAEMNMSPAEAISAATINGAYAVARGHLCGSLEPSKAADILLVNLSDYRDLPAQFGINHVHMVLKNGKVIYREGEVTRWTVE